MIMTSLCPGDAITRLFGLRQKRYGNLFDFCSDPAKRSGRNIKTFLHFTRHHLKEKFPRYPQSKPGQFSCCTPTLTYTFSFVISAIANRCKNCRSICCRPCQRPNTIVRHRQRNHARDIHATKSRFQSHSPAQRRRDSNRSPGVRANTPKTKSRSHSSSRTSTRTSRKSCRIPG